jgi:hypothetical protein
MQSTNHELIYGRIASGKTETVRQHLAEELAAENVQAWIVDPHMALPEFAGKATKYASSRTDIQRLTRGLITELTERGKQLAGLGAAGFEPGDPRHGLPLIVVTVEEAHQVLADREVRAVMERVVKDGRKTGIFSRLVVSSKQQPNLNAFGGSEVIRSAATGGHVVACERATV